MSHGVESDAVADIYQRYGVERLDVCGSVARGQAGPGSDVEPILFARTRGQWYLVGWCRLRSAVRWFVLSRVRRATATRAACTGHSVSEIGTPPESARHVGPAGSAEAHGDPTGAG